MANPKFALAIICAVIVFNQTSNAAEPSSQKETAPKAVATAADTKARTATAKTSTSCDCQLSSAGNAKGRKTYADSCICDKYPVFDLGGAWLFYADLYDICPYCEMPETVYDVEAPPYHVDTCPNCNFWGSARDAKSEAPQLARAKPWAYTKLDFFNDLYQKGDIKGGAFDNLQLDYAVEDSGKPVSFFIKGNGIPVYAKVFLLSVKPANHEMIVGALGVETDAPPAGTPPENVYSASRASPHNGWKHAYDVKLGPVTYLIITAQ